jgi:hypothetical protein
MKEQKYFSVPVVLREVYETNFIVRASSEAEARKKIREDVESGAGYVFDRATDNCIHRDIHPRKGTPVEASSLPEEIRKDTEDINIWYR